MHKRGGGRQRAEKCLGVGTHVENEMLRNVFEAGECAIFKYHSPFSLACSSFPPIHVRHRA